MTGWSSASPARNGATTTCASCQDCAWSRVVGQSVVSGLGILVSRCGTPPSHARTGGRAAVWCPHCQPG
ncbi:hypothetical protein FG385_33470 [Amycolatopsis alkalitolerans]|uniref:Uncharacterized protein n=1 Tax=Amycolatopsis alkalitolerans TaxID=2547244 RepID=A0A5C4LR29_9PSEU|nr:hypothetical protein FG385_33470 [Amycolatopsis alkalitolerans]